MDRRTVLKAGLVRAGTGHTAIAEPATLAPLAETKHAKLKRLAWEISDLLNGLEPGYDYVTIQPSAVGKSAVLFMFNIEQELDLLEDPLIATIGAYRKGLEEFNRLAHLDDNDERWDEFTDKTYGPSLACLNRWQGPALTRDSAVAALRLAMDDENGVAGIEAADRMIRAVLGYLEGLA